MYEDAFDPVTGLSAADTNGNYWNPDATVNLAFSGSKFGEQVNKHNSRINYEPEINGYRKSFLYNEHLDP